MSYGRRRGSVVQSLREVGFEQHLDVGLIHVVARRDVDDVQGRPAPLEPSRFAALGDVAAFIEERLDERRLEALLLGLSLIDWPRAARWAGTVLRRLLPLPWEPGTFWNVPLNVTPPGSG